MNIPQRSPIFYMKKALAQARIAAQKGEVPVGAIIIDAHGTVLARARNAVMQRGCQSAHAEIRAIQRACQKRNDWRLDDCILFVTLEPCVMCFGLIVLSRIQMVVYGAASPLFGSGIDKQATPSLYKKGPSVIGGVCHEESVALLKLFFQKRRQGKE